ncbi:MAG: RnfH family protein [Proteobacteria bacterium]|uniref:RnfH family protein n=1 Tax=Rudaea sp. TaxID=2136325 RepID=UPI00321FF273|nr:RnfH family protein [Pseudomonadota bacterium]
MPETSPAQSASTIQVEVVYAEPRRQIVRAAIVAADATVEEAITASGIRDELPAGFAPASIGVFGHAVESDAPLRDGDRVELYRALVIDPKQARRRRAQMPRD